MSEHHLILGVHLSDRVKQAVDVQRVFTEFGYDIKTRVGRHDPEGRVCGSGGVILPELVGGEESYHGLHRAARGYRGCRGSADGRRPRGPKPSANAASLVAGRDCLGGAASPGIHEKEGSA